MAGTNVGKAEITNEMVSRFHELSVQAKEIEGELKELKKRFNAYFDQTVGENSKGELCIGDFKLQRQIRKTENYHETKTVQKLEELNLTDCIRIVKQPDKEKIDAALTLGIIPESVLNDCLVQKFAHVVVVKKTRSRL
ncbi:hypothetical protein WD019_08385 [Fictibacillus sp. Mic-4]|uniref:hypothetical protein n=1 Tax=Fictibacillus TaxID=1329200 RepID=UPI000413A030|nr:hypothetical protein [Fictibacillus gelatini]